MNPQTVAASLLLLPALVDAQDPPRIGEPFDPPGAKARDVATYGFLADRPSARISAPHRLEITLQTLEPTPSGKVYVGLNTMDEDLDWPRYRLSGREVEDGPESRREHRFLVAFQALRGTLPNTAYEPRVVWRVELWVPSKRASRVVEGRVYFDPETGGDTVNVTYGPIVDQVTTDSAVISWQTDRQSDGVVTIGDRTFRSTGEGTWHEVRVTGLEPGTEYPYRVRSGKTEVRSYAFRTASTGPFRFAAMVDSREGVGGGMQNYGGVEGASMRALLTDAYRRGAEFVLFPGDLVNGYTASVVDFEMQLEAWRRITEPVHARIPIYEGMGNHEALFNLWPRGLSFVRADRPGDESAEAAFGRAFVNPTNGPANEGDGTPTYAENVYWFDRGTARVFVLNNNYWWCSDPHRHGGNLEGYILQRQLDWLREQVAKADAEPQIAHLFFAAQEPPFPNGGHTGDSMWYRGGDTNADGTVDGADIDIVQNRNALWQIVAGSAKTAAFITGDEHAYSRLLVEPDTPIGPRTLPDGSRAEFRHAVWQITSGGAGAPFYDKELDLPWSGGLRAHSTLPHYAMFEVAEPYVTLEVFSQSGQRIDTAWLRERGATSTRIR